MMMIKQQNDERFLNKMKSQDESRRKEMEARARNMEQRQRYMSNRMEQNETILSEK
jgi:hypothetical protein